MSGTVRSVLVEDANKMADNSLLYDLRHVLRDAFTVLDVGRAYKEPLDWSQVFFCDRYQVMLTCSALTYGSDYRFRYPCKNPDSPCRHKDGGDRPHPIPWKLDLLKDLQVRPLPKATLDRLEAGENRFETMAVLGEDWAEAPKKVVFRLLTEQEEVATSRRLEVGFGRKKKARIQARAQVLSVGDITDESTLDKMFDKLNKGMVEKLRTQMEEVDGGVVTDIKIICDRCGWEEPVGLPLGGLFRMRLRPWPWELMLETVDPVPQE